MGVSVEVMSDSEFRDLADAVHQITGISIKETRRTMLEGRIRRHLRDLDLADYPSYLNRIESDEQARLTFVDLVTTNETYFHRTPRVWSYINEKLLPSWHAAGNKKTFNAWSAAASTGEEAHTLGIMLEVFKRQHANFDYQIHGTDIASSVIKTANLGVYNGKSISRFRRECPDHFATFMTGNETDGYSVLDCIKRKIQFQTGNLFELKPSHIKYDLILLRNVLIYFTNSDQSLVMKHLHDRLSPDGITIIGESESLNYIETDFEAIEHTIYRPRRRDKKANN